jgi:hypothetical protein
LGLNRRSYKRENIEKFIKDNYMKLSASECAKTLNITEQRVRSVASNFEVADRKLSTQYSKKVDAMFFDDWDSRSSYVLGFLYADGNLSKDRITFYQKDETILDAIKQVMKIDNGVYQSGEAMRLSFNNCYMANRLREIGIREAKSTSGEMIFPTCLPNDVFAHFFRGFFDGDGSVGIYGKYENCRISIWGPQNWIRQMKAKTDRLLDIKSGGIRKASGGDDFYCCSWGKTSDVKKLYEWMYEDATLFIKRKKDIFDRKFRPKWPIEI